MAIDCNATSVIEFGNSIVGGDNKITLLSGARVEEIFSAIKEPLLV